MAMPVSEPTQAVLAAGSAAEEEPLPRPSAHTKARESRERNAENRTQREALGVQLQQLEAHMNDSMQVMQRLAREPSSVIDRPTEPTETLREEMRPTNDDEPEEAEPPGEEGTVKEPEKQHAIGASPSARQHALNRANGEVEKPRPTTRGRRPSAGEDPSSVLFFSPPERAAICF